jgi:hypothetical protein
VRSTGEVRLPWSAGREVARTDSIPETATHKLTVKFELVSTRKLWARHDPVDAHDLLVTLLADGRPTGCLPRHVTPPCS